LETRQQRLRVLHADFAQIIGGENFLQAAATG
jgi:hypothetical protein